MADTEAEAQATPQGDAAGDDVEAGAGAEEGDASTDRGTQILMAEREIVSEKVPGGMFGAVMVEVCVTLPRARYCWESSFCGTVLLC